MLCVSELCPDGEYACANQGMRAMEKYAFVSVHVNVCFYNQFVRWYTQLLVHVICNSNIINFISYFNECFPQAINPCLDGGNGGCHADGNCFHTGPNKVSRGCDE